MDTFWSVAAWSATSLVSLLAVVTSFRAVRLTRHANQLQIVLGHIKVAGTIDFVKHEAYVWDKAPAVPAGTPMSQLDEPLFDYTTEVGQYYQSLAYLSQAGMVDVDFVIQQLGYRADRTWRAIEHLVRAERELRGSENSYFNSYEELVLLSRKVDPAELDRRLRRRRHRAWLRQLSLPW